MGPMEKKYAFEAEKENGLGKPQGKSLALKIPLWKDT